MQAPSALSERLASASAARRCYPWDNTVIDWSVPIDNQYLYMPQQTSFLWGTPMWERLSFEDKSFVTRWEVTQLMRNAGAGEHLLNQGILSLLHHTDQYDTAWRYLLHEVAEECQHMAMFNEWIRLNADIRTKGLGDARWGLWASTLTPVVTIQMPVLFWAVTMLLEAVGDDLGVGQARNEAGNLHPILHQMGQAHRLEEARHIAFAKAWLTEAVPRLSSFQRRLLSEAIERLTEGLMRVGLPMRYGRQLAPYLTKREMHDALRTRHRRKMIRDSIGPTARTLSEIGVIRRGTLTRWLHGGQLPDSSSN